MEYAATGSGFTGTAEMECDDDPFFGRVVYYYAKSSDIVHVVDIWDSKMSPVNLRKRINIFYNISFTLENSEFR